MLHEKTLFFKGKAIGTEISASAHELAASCTLSYVWYAKVCSTVFTKGIQAEHYSSLHATRA